MKRRGLREVARIEPGQIAILECDAMLTMEQAAAIKDAWKTVASNVECIVLSKPITLAGVCNVRPWKRAR